MNLLKVRANGPRKSPENIKELKIMSNPSNLLHVQFANDIQRDTTLKGLMIEINDEELPYKKHTNLSINSSTVTIELKPKTIGLFYIRHLLIGSIKAKGEKSEEVKLCENSGRFGYLIFTQDYQVIKAKLEKNKRDALSGTIYVQGNYDEEYHEQCALGMSPAEIERKTGAICIANDVYEGIKQDNIEFAKCSAAFIAKKLIVFSFHYAKDTFATFAAQYYDLYTFVTDPDGVLLTARTFSHIRTITSAIFDLPLDFKKKKNRKGEQLTTPFEVLVGLGYCESYEFNKAMFELTHKLDKHNLIYVFWSEPIEPNLMGELLKDEETWNKEYEIQKQKPEAVINPYIKNKFGKWDYALTPIHQVKSTDAFNSISFPIPQQSNLSIQLTIHPTNTRHVFEFAQEIEDLLNPPNQ